MKKEERIKMYPQDVRLLMCKNIWSKDHKKLTHLLTYEISYENGRIERIIMTVDSPFTIDHFETYTDPGFGIYELSAQYLCLSTPDNRAMIKGDVKTVVIKEADPVEMSVEEIEAALGKKIKIVSKE